MKFKRTFVTYMFGCGFLCVAIAGVTNGKPRCQKASDLPVEVVRLCDLIKNPRRYDGKALRLKAVLVENHNARVDGGDPVLYDPECPGKEFSVVVEWPIEFYEKSKDAPAHRALDEIRGRPDERGNTRASVILVGEFRSSGQRQYGHLDWADAEFVVHDVGAAEPVASTVAWQK